MSRREPDTHEVGTTSNDRPPGQRRELRMLAVALVLSMSTWFSTAAVLGQLSAAWDLGSTAKSWLIIALQLGFVVGAAGSSLANLADRILPAVSCSSAQLARRWPMPSSSRSMPTGPLSALGS